MRGFESRRPLHFAPALRRSPRRRVGSPDGPVRRGFGSWAAISVEMASRVHTHRRGSDLIRLVPREPRQICSPAGLRCRRVRSNRPGSDCCRAPRTIRRVSGRGSGIVTRSPSTSSGSPGIVGVPPRADLAPDLRRSSGFDAGGALDGRPRPARASRCRRPCSSSARRRWSSPPGSCSRGSCAAGRSTRSPRHSLAAMVAAVLKDTLLLGTLGAFGLFMAPILIGVDLAIIAAALWLPPLSRWTCRCVASGAGATARRHRVAARWPRSSAIVWSRAGASSSWPARSCRSSTCCPTTSGRSSTSGRSAGSRR